MDFVVDLFSYIEWYDVNYIRRWWEIRGLLEHDLKGEYVLRGGKWDLRNITDDVSCVGHDHQ